jgi:outer membrane immunogenic protein
MHFSVGRTASAALILLLPLAAAPARAQDQSLWGGWYVGANAGGSWGDTKLSSQVATGTGAVVIPPADVALINGVNSNGSNKTGFTGGVEGGYNYVMDDWLFGIEGEWVALSTNSRDSHSVTSGITLPIIPPPAPVVYTSNQRADTDWMVDIRPRIGYVAGPWLFFASAGVAFADVKASQQLTANTTPAQIVQTENSSTKTGWIVGLGAGYALDSQWSIKGEYLYADFGTTRTTGVSPNGFASLTSSAEVKTNILRVGVDYRF